MILSLIQYIRINCNVKEGWDVLNGQGRCILFITIAEKNQTFLLPGFTGAITHQSKENLLLCSTGSAIMSCEIIVTEFEGNERSVKYDLFMRHSRKYLY